MNSADTTSDSIVSTHHRAESNSTQMSLTFENLTDKVGVPFPNSALGVQSLSSRLLAFRDSNSQSFTLSYGPWKCGPRHQQTHRSRAPTNKRSNSIGWLKQVSYSTREMAYQGSSSIEVTPPDGSTQCNGNHFLLRGEV